MLCTGVAARLTCVVQFHFSALDRILCLVQEGAYVLQAGGESVCSAPSADGLQKAGESGHVRNGAQEKCMSNGEESAQKALLLGQWVKLWDRRQPGRDMASGMRMM